MSGLSQVLFRRFGLLLTLAAFQVAALDLRPPPPAPEATTESTTEPAAKPEAAGAVVDLPEVTVKGQRNAFEESDRRLKKLIDESTPCLGCDVDKIERAPSLLKRAADTAAYLVTPQSNQAVDPEFSLDNELDRAEFEKRLPTNRNP